MNNNYVIEIHKDDAEQFTQLLEQCAMANQSSSDLEILSNDENIIPDTFTELIIAGKSIALAIIPVIAFYLGKGRKVIIKTKAGKFILNGYKPEEIIILMKAFKD